MTYPTVGKTYQCQVHPHVRFVVESVTDEGVRCYPDGGGFQYLISRHEFESDFIPYEPPKRARRGLFTGDWLEEGVAFEGWTFGERWNGWACPYFELPVVAEMLRRGGMGVHFDPVHRTYYAECDRECNPDYPGDAVMTIHDDEGREVKVVALGAGSWCWDEVKETKEIDDEEA